MNSRDFKILNTLDDGSLYACPGLIEELFRYPHLSTSFLLVNYNEFGQANGYIPVGVNPDGDIASYIPGIPSSPPISPTYTPGAKNVIQNLDYLIDRSLAYIDVDMVDILEFSHLEETASAYCLSLDAYLSSLSKARRKDIRRKLSKYDGYELVPGSMDDVMQAWPWMKKIWLRRDAYDSEHIARVISWLKKIEASNRAEFKVLRYQHKGKVVAVNCCVIHEYKGKTHIDDYLTWFDIDEVPGLGIVTAVNNLTNPEYYNFRYNLGLPGFYGQTFEGHQYKWDVIPASLRLEQSIINIRPAFRTIS